MHVYHYVDLTSAAFPVVDSTSTSTTSDNGNALAALSLISSKSAIVSCFLLNPPSTYSFVAASLRSVGAATFFIYCPYASILVSSTTYNAFEIVASSTTRS